MASSMRSGLLRQACQTPALFALPKAAARRPFAQRLLQPQTTRIAAFHATQRKEILPPPPQVIEGTANDPVPVPTPSPSHGSYHWSFERLVSAGLIPLTIAPFAAGSLNPVTDSILCALLVTHSHIGFEACIVDYFPGRRVPTLRGLSMWALRLGTLTLGVALYSFETHDVGITEAVTRLWYA